MSLGEVTHAIAEYLSGHWKSIIGTLVLFVIAFVLFYYVYLPNKGDDGNADKATGGLLGAVIFAAGGAGTTLVGILSGF